jgi:hypothetical protein
MEVGGRHHALSTLPQGKNAFTRLVRGWLDPELVWTIWRRDESSTGIRSPDRLFRCLVAVGVPSKVFGPQQQISKQMNK